MVVFWSVSILQTVKNEFLWTGFILDSECEDTKTASIWSANLNTLGTEASVSMISHKTIFFRRLKCSHNLFSMVNKHKYINHKVHWLSKLLL